jgi:hypothetical protein
MSKNDFQNAAEPSPLAITGRDVALAVVSDFSRFFDPMHPFAVGFRVGAVSSPCVRSDKTGSYIVIPREMAEDVIITPERLLFHLLMLGHEIAHLVHKHLDGASSQSDDDYRSLELWADFYGAKVAMTLLTYGKQTHLIAKAYWPHRNVHQLLLDVGGAVAFLVASVYKDHRKYPPKLERAALTSNGVMSFVRNYYGSQFDIDFYYSVPIRILLSQAAMRELILLDGGRTDFADDPINRATEWHRRAQAGATSITPGFLPHVLNYLHTTFSHTDEEIEESRRIRLGELKRAGLLDDLDDGEDPS